MKLDMNSVAFIWSRTILIYIVIIMLDLTWRGANLYYFAFVKYIQYLIFCSDCYFKFKYKTNYWKWLKVNIMLFTPFFIVLILGVVFIDSHVELFDGYGIKFIIVMATYSVFVSCLFCLFLAKRIKSNNFSGKLLWRLNVIIVLVSGWLYYIYIHTFEYTVSYDYLLLFIVYFRGSKLMLQKFDVEVC